MEKEKDQLGKEQLKTLKKLRTGKNICLLGGAGTGKTFLLNRYIEECKDAGKNVIVTAPTGMAASHMDGVTMHSAFTIPIPAYGKYEFDITIRRSMPVYVADVIIIDEISMCRNDVFEYFSYVVKATLKKRKEDGDIRKLQIIVSGDFSQLPPVVKEDEKDKFKKLALDASGYCFTTPAWKEFKFETVVLTEIFRQDEEEFIQNLDLLRKGNTGCISYFNKRVKEEQDYPPDSVFICSTNAKADEINTRELNKIDGPSFVYVAKREGFTGKDYSVPENLVLKEGARVMFMVNDYRSGTRNGQSGIVEECLSDSVMVRLLDGTLVEVERYDWITNKVSVKNGMAEKKEVGKYKQVPLKLAYAATMHKTQGQTYESAVISPGSFADGQLYVALSRVKSIEGLTLTEEITPKDIRTNATVLSFYEGSYIIPESRITKKKELIKKASGKYKEKLKKEKAKKKAAKKAKSVSASKPAKKSSFSAKATAKKPAKPSKPASSVKKVSPSSTKKKSTPKKVTSSNLSKKPAKKTKQTPKTKTSAKAPVKSPAKTNRSAKPAGKNTKTAAVKKTGNIKKTK